MSDIGASDRDHYRDLVEKVGVVTALPLRLRLFLISCAPLFAILAVRFDSTWLWVTCGALALFGFAQALRVVTAARNAKASRRVVVTRVDDSGGEVAGYLATYLLPFVVISTPSVRDIIAYILFMFVTAVIFVRSNLAHVNPTLYLVGYRVVSIESEDGRKSYLVCKQPPREHDHLSVVPLVGILVLKENHGPSPQG